jgi:hypothetical protein
VKEQGDGNYTTQKSSFSHVEQKNICISRPRATYIKKDQGQQVWAVGSLGPDVSKDMNKITLYQN